MLSLIAAPNHYRFSPSSFPPLNSSAVFVVRLTTRQALPGLGQNLTAVKQENQFPGVVRRCKSGENVDSSALEQEVLEFMLQSEDPDRFPSRKELIVGGRRDLAEAIVKRGGWMTRGWDLASDDESEKAELDVLLSKWNSISSNLGQGQEKRVSKINGVANKSEPSLAKIGSINGFAALCDSSHPSASPSGRSVETEADENAGIEGILNRLDKQRNWSLGLRRERKASSVFSKNDLHSGGSEAADSCYPRNDAEAGLSCENNTVAIQEKVHSGLRRTNGLKKLSNLNGLRTSLKPDTWRTWSIQRAGLSDNDFEAAEINFDHSREVIAPNSPTEQIIALHEGNKEEPPEMIENSKHSDKYCGDNIRSRLHNIELELSSALGVLRSDSGDILTKVHHKSGSEDYMDLSDELEFKENEIFNARDKLRSLRARLAVLEGKVALTRIDNQKLRDEKRNMITDSHKAVQLLRTTCVVWPNSASEVLLTGSFDGWATQRKMVKSSNGVFSLSLRLYPGRYEFKFIVDGVWKVDPLRPTINNNGNENNQLIIT
ncbi:hypothetical protein V2J09_013028 [Rumex salicifolius]